MAFIDVHAHLDFKDFDNDRKEIETEMEKSNIKALSNTLSPENYEYTKKIFGDSKVVSVCPGLYPQEAEKISDEDFSNYLKKLKKEKKNFLAIGEVGLDRHHTTDPELWKIQENRFRKLIELGIKIDRPLIIHTRKAEERTLEILREYVEKYNFRKFDLHCFSGKKKLISQIKDLGIYCSIPLTVLNTESFQYLAKELPINKILTETDSPFLNPEKIRNSSLNIPKVCEKISQIRGLDLKEMENIIYKNYMSFIN